MTPTPALEAEEKAMKRDAEYSRGFASGICVACAILADEGGDTYAEEILAATGLSTASEALQECERLRAEFVMLRDERAFYAKGDHSMTQAWARQRRAFERIETADTSQQMRDIAREQLSEGQPRRALGAAK